MSCWHKFCFALVAIECLFYGFVSCNDRYYDDEGDVDYDELTCSEADVWNTFDFGLVGTIILLWNPHE